MRFFQKRNLLFIYPIIIVQIKFIIKYFIEKKVICFELDKTDILQIWKRSEKKMFIDNLCGRVKIKKKKKHSWQGTLVLR